MEEKVAVETVSDPRVQSFRSDEDRVAAAVKKSKMPDEPREILEDREEQVGGLKVVKLEVVMPELMYRKMVQVVEDEDYFGLNDFICECVRVRTVCVAEE